MKNALKAFEKAQTAKLADKKMRTSSENRERQFEELREQLRCKSEMMMAAVKLKKAKICRLLPKLRLFSHTSIYFDNFFYRPPCAVAIISCSYTGVHIFLRMHCLYTNTFFCQSKN